MKHEENPQILYKFFHNLKRKNITTDKYLEILLIVRENMSGTVLNINTHLYLKKILFLADSWAAFAINQHCKRMNKINKHYQISLSEQGCAIAFFPLESYCSK